VSDGCAGSGVIRSCCVTGPLTLVDGEGPGNGLGIRPCKILVSGRGLGTAVPLILAGLVTLEISVLIGLPLNFANIIARTD
jgi:hypothetical protein